MKTASMVLGIVGGALAIISGFALIIAGGSFGSDAFSLDLPHDFPMEIFTAVFATLWMFGILYLAGGVLGLTGGIIVKNKPVAAGVLLIIGAVLTCFSIPLILAAIFAFVREKPVEPAPAYPPLYPPYVPPYPPQAPPYGPVSGNTDGQA